MTQRDPTRLGATMVLLVLGGSLGGSIAIVDGQPPAIAVAFTLGGAFMCGILGRML